MMQPEHQNPQARQGGWIVRLARDRSGNTLAIVAASIAPLLALVGGGIDMGRSYLSETRLQQACDAGVLAARKKLGAAAPADGLVPAAVGTVGQSFFNLNFRDGSYGTENRQFTMTLESDYAISGVATVDVPTTIMKIFGNDEIPLTVNCQARLNFSNTDVMMVLDTTGSMNETNSGDSETKIAALRRVVKDFHAQLEAAKSPGTRIRYGFVPYSTNVNVGWLLNSGWMVDETTIQGRRAMDTGATTDVPQYSTTYNYISGTETAVTTYTAAACPASTANWTTISYTPGPNGSGSGTVEVSGDSYWCNPADSNLVTVNGVRYNRYRYSYVTTFNGYLTVEVYKWQYRQLDLDVRSLKGATADAPMAGGTIGLRMAGAPSPEPSMLNAAFQGCIEERKTYEITDYSAVDLDRALDLNLDLVPDPSDPDTQWRPMLHEFSFEREIWWDGTGTFRKTPVTTSNEYLMAGWAGLSACPAPSHKLAEMNAGDVSTYVDSLVAAGNTYHDIGMIWGGRLISPTGLFASENGNVDGKPTSRHLIFLTDGQTAPLDISFSSYGIEPLDERRWSKSSASTLTQVVENRFAFACNEVKNKNVTVWVIGFGTEMNDLMKNCAGPGRWFQADDSAQLTDAFTRIAKAMGELRISR
jgi:hypothetical protein